MSQARDIAQGFFLTSTAICILITFGQLASYTNTWTGLAFSSLLTVLFIINLLTQYTGWNQRRKGQNLIKQVKAVIMGLQGVGLACWSLDVITTVFVINIQAVGIEVNPLGWPFGIIGAAIYFVPAIFGTYYLLYRAKTIVSFYVAVVLTAVSLVMAWMNLVAGMNNFLNGMRFIQAGTHLEIIGSWLAIVIIIISANTAAIIIEKKNDKFRSISFKLKSGPSRT